MKKLNLILLSIMIGLPLSVAPALASNTVTPVGDTVTPSTPINIVASVTSPSQINLNWSASTDNVGVIGYNIYRNGNFVRFFTKNSLVGMATSTNFNVTGLKPDTLYKYTIRAVDAAGNLSAKSIVVSATTLEIPDTLAPSVPTDLKAFVYSSKQINLHWDKSKDNVKVIGYNIYRNSVLIGTSSKTSFKSIELLPATLYSYSISSIDAVGNVSAQSALVTATTLIPDTTPPSVPTDLVVSFNHNKNMLTWSASTDNVGVTEYVIMRNGLVLANSTKTKYIDKAALPTTVYIYSIAAIDADGNTSATSALATITTPVAKLSHDKDDKKENKLDKHQNDKIKNLNQNNQKKLDQKDSKHNSND